MSFKAEMDDFIKAADVMSGVRYRNANRRKIQYESGEIPYPDVSKYSSGSGAFPGGGGGVGTTTAPADGGSVSTSGFKVPDLGKGGDMPNAGGKALINTFYDYYRSKGLSHNHAAAIAGNLQQESGGDPRVISGVRKGDGGISSFAAQWNGKRLQNLMAFAKQRGNDKPTLQDQLDFVLEEGREGGPFADPGAVKAHQLAAAAPDLATATEVFMTNFERPNAKFANLEGRVKFAQSLSDTGGGATQVASGAIADDKEKDQAPAPEPADTGEDQATVEQPTITAPEVQQQPVPVTQVENQDWFGIPGFHFDEGGAVPDDSYGWNFAAGGQVDAYNPDRSYTQPITTPHRNPALMNTTKLGSGADWRSWGDTTPNQAKFRAQPKVTPAPAPVAPPPAPAAPAPTMAFSTSRFMRRMNSDRGVPGGAKMLQQAQGLYKKYAAGQATPDEIRWLQTNHFLVPIQHFAEGGMVRTSDTPRSRLTQREFDEMVREEERRSFGRGSSRSSESARDRVAKRVAQQERGVVSSAFRPGAERYPPAPRSGGGGKGGGKKGGAGAVSAGGRAAQNPWDDMNKYGPPNRYSQDPWRDMNKYGAPGAPGGGGGGGGGGATVPWYMGGAEAPPGGDTGNEDVPWQLGGANPPNRVTDLQGNPITVPDVDPRSPIPGVQAAVPGTEVPFGGSWNTPTTGFARGGAIPDDEYDLPRNRTQRRRSMREEEAGYTTSLTGERSSAAKRRGQPRPAVETKGSTKLKKRKPGGREAGKRQSRRVPDTGEVPIPRPRPGGRDVPYEQRKPEPSPNVPYERRKPEPSPNVPYEQRRPEPTRDRPYEQRRPEPPQYATRAPMETVRSVVPETAYRYDERYRPRQQPLPAEDVITGTPPPQQGPPYRAPKPSDEYFDWANAIVQGAPSIIYDELFGGEEPAQVEEYPPPPRPGVRKVYARGGAIPDDYANPSAGGGSYAPSPASEDVASQEAGPWGAPRPTMKVSFNEAAEGARHGVQAGIEGIKRIFGLDPSATGGIPTPEGGAAQQQGVQRFARGEGAATNQEVQAVDRTFGIDEVDADESTKNLIRVDKVVQYWLEHGDKDKAEAAAASLLMRGAVEVRRAGIMAATALQQYQQTGDPQDLRNATIAIKKAHSVIPDGVDIQIDIDPKTRQVVATSVDADGKQQKQVVDPAAIPGLLKQAMDGSAYWTAAYQIGQPRLAEQELVNAGAAGRTAADHAFQVQWEAEKNRRELGEQLDKEEREQGYKLAEEERAGARKMFERSLDTEEGRTESERRRAETAAYFDDWADRYQATEDPAEQQQLITEGLQYRWQNTPDRQTPIENDLLAYDANSPYAQTFQDADIPAIRNLAGTLALKNDGMDAGRAMETVAALIMHPTEFNADGTMRVDGWDLVFNPSLLPALDGLRKKYKPRGE